MDNDRLSHGALFIILSSILHNSSGNQDHTKLLNLEEDVLDLQTEVLNMRKELLLERKLRQNLSDSLNRTGYQCIIDGKGTGTKGIAHHDLKEIVAQIYENSDCKDLRCFHILQRSFQEEKDKRRELENKLANTERIYSSVMKTVNTCEEKLNMIEKKFDGLASKVDNIKLFGDNPSAGRSPGSAPRNVYAVPVSSQTIMVNWKEPEIPNGIIQGYKIFYTLKPDLPIVLWNTQDVNSATKTTIISNLEPNCTYTLSILAFSNMGQGPLSETIQVMTTQGDTCSVPSLPGTLYNYNISNDTVPPGPVSSGRKVKVTCEEGYNSVSYGSNVSTCTNGIWEPALSHCEKKVECDSLSDNFKVIKVGVIQGKLSHQTIVEISCNKSQSPFYDVKKATCNETFWKPWKPYCANTCLMPPLPGTLYNYNITNKMVLPGPVSSGREIKVTCEEGYDSVLHSSNVSTCTNGIWEPALSLCERKDCPKGKIHWNSTSYRKGPKKYISYRTYLTENECFRSCEKDQSCKAVYMKTVTNLSSVHCKLFALNTKDMPHEFTRSGVETETIYDKACVDCLNGTIYWNSTSYRRGPKKYISYSTYLTENECFRSCEKDQSCKAVYMKTLTHLSGVHCKLFALNTKDMSHEFTRSGVETETIYDKACVEASERDVPIK